MRLSKGDETLLEKIKEKDSSDLGSGFQKKEGINPQEYEDQRRVIDISFRQKLLILSDKLLNKCFWPIVLSICLVIFMMPLTLATYLYHICGTPDKLYNVITSVINYILLSSVSYLYGKLKK